MLVGLHVLFMELCVGCGLHVMDTEFMWLICRIYDIYVICDAYECICVICDIYLFVLMAKQVNK